MPLPPLAHGVRGDAAGSMCVVKHEVGRQHQGVNRRWYLPRGHMDTGPGGTQKRTFLHVTPTPGHTQGADMGSSKLVMGDSVHRPRPNPKTVSAIPTPARVLAPYLRVTDWILPLVWLYDRLLDVGNIPAFGRSSGGLVLTMCLLDTNKGLHPKTQTPVFINEPGGVRTRDHLIKSQTPAI